MQSFPHVDIVYHSCIQRQNLEASQGFTPQNVTTGQHPHSVSQHTLLTEEHLTIPDKCECPLLLVTHIRCALCFQVGFVMRLEGERLSAALEDCLPDYQFAFEGNGAEVDGMYYHTDKTQELNAHFGDMLHKIQDLEVGVQAKQCT